MVLFAFCKSLRYETFPEKTPKTISHGNLKFKVQKNYAIIGKSPSSCLLHRYCQVLHYELQNLFLTFCVVKNGFFSREYLKQSYGSLQCSREGSVQTFCPLVVLTCRGFLLKAYGTPRLYK